MIDLNIVIPIASSGIVGAIIGSKISTELNVFLLKKFFGFFLGAIAISEIYLLIKENRISKKTNNKNRY